MAGECISSVCDYPFSCFSHKVGLLWYVVFFFPYPSLLHLAEGLWILPLRPSVSSIFVSYSPPRSNPAVWTSLTHVSYKGPNTPTLNIKNHTEYTAIL